MPSKSVQNSDGSWTHYSPREVRQHNFNKILALGLIVALFIVIPQLQNNSPSDNKPAQNPNVNTPISSSPATPDKDTTTNTKAVVLPPSTQLSEQPREVPDNDNTRTADEKNPQKPEPPEPAPAASISDVDEIKLARQLAFVDSLLRTDKLTAARAQLLLLRKEYLQYPDVIKAIDDRLSKLGK